MEKGDYMEFAIDELGRDKILRSIANHQLIIEILLENRDPDGVCRLTQGDLAQKTGFSRTSVAKKLRRLEKVDNCIEKVGRGGAYIVNCNNPVEAGPFKKVLSFLDAVMNKPDLLTLTIKEIAIHLQFTVYEVEMIWGYIYQSYGAPEKTE